MEEKKHRDLFYTSYAYPETHFKYYLDSETEDRSALSAWLSLIWSLPPCQVQKQVALSPLTPSPLEMHFISTLQNFPLAATVFNCGRPNQKTLVLHSRGAQALDCSPHWAMSCLEPGHRSGGHVCLSLTQMELRACLCVLSACMNGAACMSVCLPAARTNPSLLVRRPQSLKRKDSSSRPLHPGPKVCLFYMDRKGKKL